jgi:hypothetical protein
MRLARQPVTYKRRIARLTRERDEAIEQQSATANVLRLISSSAGELEPVFEAILENVTRICDAKFATLYLREGDLFRAVALHNAPAAYTQRRLDKLVNPPSDTALGLAIRTNKVAADEIEALVANSSVCSRSVLASTPTMSNSAASAAIARTFGITRA